MQHTTDEKQARARDELNRLYPGLTNKQVTDIQRQRLEWAQKHPLGTDLDSSTAAKIVEFNMDIREPGRELWELAVKGESTIYSYIQTWQATGGSYTEMLEKLVIHLAGQKKEYYEQFLAYVRKYGVEPTVEPDEGSI